MNILIFAAPRYAFVLALLAASFAVGAATLSSLKVANRAETIVFCTTFGLGLISHLVLFIGLLGELTPPVLLAAIAACGLIGATFALRRRQSHAIVAQGLPRGVLAASILFVAAAVSLLVWPVALLPLYPPTDFDSTMYHLVAPKIWVQAHSILPTPFLRIPIGPNLAHTLFSALMAVEDDVSAQILSLAAIVLVAAGLYGWGCRIRSPLVGCLAAGLWLGSPAVLKMADVPSYHALASLFSFACISALAEFTNTRKPGWLFVSAAFAGFGESTWSMTTYFLPIVLAVTGYFAVSQRNWRLPLLCGLGLILGWGPTLARCAWYTGNPTFPLFAELFGSGPWWTMKDLAEIGSNMHQIGSPRTIANFIAMPYLLARFPAKYQSPVSYSVALFALLPLTIAKCIGSRYIRWLMAIVAFYFLCWFTIAQVMRYLLPVVPVLCIATALAVDWLLERLDRFCHLRQSLLTAVVSYALLVPGLTYAQQELRTRGHLPLTPEDRASSVLRRRPAIAALSIANAAPAPLYSLFGTDSAYYYNGLFMGDYVGPGRFTQVFNALANGETLYTALHRLNAHYFLVNWRKVSMPVLPYDAKFDRRFQQLFANASVELYRLNDSPGEESSAPQNLLKNPGFDELNNGRPVGWLEHGAPRVVQTPRSAYSAPADVEVSSNHYLYQTVDVVAGSQYELRLYAKAIVPVPFRQQVNWNDAQKQPCGKFARVFTAGANWQVFVGRMQAPAAAVTADVVATGDSDRPVMQDSFTFRRLDTEAHAESSGQ